jgi:hypothetical protein
MIPPSYPIEMRTCCHGWPADTFVVLVCLDEVYVVVPSVLLLILSHRERRGRMTNTVCVSSFLAAYMYLDLPFLVKWR